MLISVGGDVFQADMITNILDDIYILVPILHCVDRGICLFVLNSKLAIFHKQKTVPIWNTWREEILFEKVFMPLCKWCGMSDCQDTIYTLALPFPVCTVVEQPGIARFLLWESAHFHEFYRRMLQPCRDACIGEGKVQIGFINDWTSSLEWCSGEGFRRMVTHDNTKITLTW